MNEKKYFHIDYLIVLLFFLLIYLSTKKFLSINFDTSIFIEQIWRIYNGQIQHVDFNSPFGPFIYYQYFFYYLFIDVFRPSTSIISHENIVNYSSIFKLFISYFVITYLFLFHYFFNKFEKFNRFFLYLIVIFIGSFFISPRGYGYTYLISLTSYYNMYIEGAVILTIYTFFYIYLYFFDVDKKINFKHLFVISLLGFFNFQLILLKITAGLLIFPIIFFLIKNFRLKRIVRYYLFGYFFGFIFSLFFFGYEIIFGYFKDVLDIFKIRFFDLSSDSPILHPLKLRITLNSLVDLLSFFILLSVLKNSEIEACQNVVKTKKNILLISFFFFSSSYILQLFSAQNPESNLKNLCFLIILLIIFKYKTKFIKKKIYIFIPCLFSFWVIFKNIIFSVTLFFYSIFYDLNNDLLNKLKTSYLLDNKYLKKLESRLNYSQLGAYEKILYFPKMNGINIEKIIPLIDENDIVSSYACDFPVSYFLKAKPAKNTNLYWHYGVTIGNTINLYNTNDDTTHFLFCFKGNAHSRKKLYESLYINHYFKEIYFDNNVTILKKINKD